MSATSEIVIESGAVIDVPLNKLRRSPRNARRTPHSEAAIEALAASIAAKGVLQAPVVEPESGQAAARAKGKERYEGFIEALGRRLHGGTSVLKEVSSDLPATLNDRAGSE